MHSPTSHVRIFDYILSSTNPRHPHEDDHSIHITSAVYFTKEAESHQGLCHGGTMCAVMDDVIGWTGFCESGECHPWSGYTVQVDTSLKKPIAIGSFLKVEGWIERREGRRKVHIKARLTDEHGTEHAVGSGLFLKK
jgi:acyl-coenzyme A thioesterase PaaI-like protein